MTNFLFFLSLFSGVTGIFAYQWITFLPWVGIGYLYQMRRVKWVWRLLTMGLALVGWLLAPTAGGLVVLAFGVILAGLAGASNPNRVLVAVTDPPPLAADKAELGEDAPVLGLAWAGESRAWALELLVPHHLVNDRLGGEPVLAAW
ncbi:MAG: DUF3179 domain-containing protein [Chloroflexi bacterium]|nr:DUF3179 domain-containing protein [Chloroflexota bacterium]